MNFTLALKPCYKYQLDEQRTFEYRGLLCFEKCYLILKKNIDCILSVKIQLPHCQKSNLKINFSEKFYIVNLILWAIKNDFLEFLNAILTGYFWIFAPKIIAVLRNFWHEISNSNKN